MKPLFTSLLVCLLPFMAQAQDAIHISGITTEKDGSILIGAHIIAYDSAGYELPYKTFSDVNGQFDLSIPLSANVSYLTVICICYALCGKECTWILNELKADAAKSLAQDV